MLAKKKIGIGSCALLLSMIAILWCANISFWDEFCLGDHVLRVLGLPTWSNSGQGVHYTVFYGLIFTVPAILLGVKNKNHLFAVSGKRIAVILTVVLVAAPLFMVF